MTISMKRAAFLLSGTIAAGMYGSVSMAADVETDDVSSGGFRPQWQDRNWWRLVPTIDDFSSDEIFRGGAAFSFPGWRHVRHPGRLDGARCLWRYGGGRCVAMPSRAIRIPISSASMAATLTPVQPISGTSARKLNCISAMSRSRQLAATWISATVVGSEFYAVGNLALYATDNLRLSVGASTVANFELATYRP